MDRFTPPATLALLLILTASPVCAAAEVESDVESAVQTTADETGFSGGFEVDVPSRYVARGVGVNQGPAFQPAAWIARSGLTATAWSSFDPAGQRALAAKPTDLTAALAWETEIGPLSIEPSVTYITYPDLADVPTTVEAAVTTSLGIGPVSACVTNIVDTMAFQGAWYGWAGLCFEQSFGERTVLEANGGAGLGNRAFNEVNFGVVSWGLDHVEANLALTLPLTDAAYLRAHATASRLVHRDLLRELPEPMVAFAGAAVGFEM